MKVVIFAGGLGTRIAEETDTRPKPMVEIGGKPILWHIMKIYSQYGFNDFIICLGYKGFLIKEYFMQYFLHNSDITIELGSNKLDVHYTNTESFKVTLVDTGLNTKTAGRLKRVQQYVGNEDFMLTYGDGVSDVDLKKLLEFHKAHNKAATVTAIQPEARFGGMEMGPDGEVISFKEKPRGDGKWINGGFFVLKPEVFKYLDGNMDDTMWEDSPMEHLAKDHQLMAYQHHGFWKCMDAMRDKLELEALWQNNQAKWKIW
ncbi:glucose-1-phosphate cytidylyltransferase [Pseudobacter ginsenosidimutans]|jgi:glucose-1-phosphate cytidylyltransferase|uniref:Glucose-1-phosphate cytidylyltransferase n=1 Tax=Pseudobacter ginsenosidimutans TaxID=661488 RepID=A0A4Q7N1P0_9BACT|nr:glucose-1-phosphate cytidylyltransferase [Pseudobacter ginsenosidimutans]QEC43858.1 glucose-1-phosphate cytidylyltransferase [Pseudobacter ginsenosidimutans]RZS75283.1 glucose-1-phosphate cytidylyltransferase [Pseudobacter ginsenosidimutans]